MSASTHVYCDMFYIGVRSHGGYAPYALLSKEKSYRVNYVPLSAKLETQIVLGKMSLGFSYSVHHGRVIYSETDIVYAGVLNADGPGMSLSLAIGRYELQFIGEFFSVSKLSLKSDIKSEVNDLIFKHSGLFTYIGGQGGVARMILLSRSKSKQTGQLYMLAGLSLDALYMPIRGMITNIATNQPSYGARVIKGENVDYTFQAISLSIFIGLEF